MKIKSKVNGLIIGQSKTTNDVVKLGRGKFADVVSDTSSKSQSKSQAKPKAKPVAVQEKATAKTDDTETVEQL